jgi:hypothetical protein
MTFTEQQIKQFVLEAASEVTGRKINDLSRETLISDLHLEFVEIAQILEKLEQRVGQDLPWDSIACDVLGSWETLGEFMDWVGISLANQSG